MIGEMSKRRKWTVSINGKRKPREFWIFENDVGDIDAFHDKESAMECYRDGDTLVTHVREVLPEPTPQVTGQAEEGIELKFREHYKQANNNGFNDECVAHLVGARYGYSLRSAEIEAMKKEVIELTDQVDKGHVANQKCLDKIRDLSIMADDLRAAHKRLDQEWFKRWAELVGAREAERSFLQSQNAELKKLNQEGVFQCPSCAEIFNKEQFYTFKDYDELKKEVEELKSKFNSKKNPGCDATCLNYSDEDTVAQIADLTAKLEIAMNALSKISKFTELDKWDEDNETEYPTCEASIAKEAMKNLNPTPASGGKGEKQCTQE